MKGILTILLLVGLLLAIGCTQANQGTVNPLANNALPEGQILLKAGFSGAGALDMRCLDENYKQDNSDYIIEGVIKKVKTKYNEAGSIVTIVDISIEKFVKGEPFGNKIQLESAGGCIGDACQIMEDSPVFVEGKKIRSYLTKVDNSYYPVCQLWGVQYLEDFCVETGPSAGWCNRVSETP
ncbi:MAG: hypothetical protein V1777_03515 [Candidatus Micrarchaeota archaeon]